jgi:hypothetical protein
MTLSIIRTVLAAAIALSTLSTASAATQQTISGPHGAVTVSCNAASDPVADDFVTIMTIARVFQLAFALPKQLETCTADSGKKFVNIGQLGLPGWAVHEGPGSEKCYYILDLSDPGTTLNPLAATYKGDPAMIDFDKLSSEYHTSTVSYGETIKFYKQRVDIPGVSGAICSHFHKAHNGYAPDTCYATLTFWGNQIEPALRAFRYIDGTCPHVEFKPY